MPTLTIGTVLKERYQILQQLGQGGMGEVYLADDLSLATKVAVKINHNLNPQASAQFIKEARLLAALKHPNLPRVIDYFSEIDSQVLVMDFIPGDDLKTIVERRDVITPQLILKWAGQLANALDYLHNQVPPVYHRDVKPANIKLTPGGDVVLVDFGIAKTGEPSQETQAGAWAFSPGFAPPEQVAGLRTGPYTDQYALAATIYYLFSGQPPAESTQRIMGAVELTPLQSLNSATPPHVSSAVQKALALKPEDRFGSVAEFRDAFEGTSPLPGSQPTVVQSTRQAVPPVPPPPPPALETKANQPPKKRSLAWLFIIIAAVVIGGGGFLLFANGFPSAKPTSIPTITVTMDVPTATIPVTLVPTFTLIPVQPSATPTIELPTITTEPVFTPIGGKVAFISNRQGDGINQVWVMDIGFDANNLLVSSDPKQVTFTPGDKSQPAWSPDGSKLLFVGPSTEFGTNGTPFAQEVWLVDLQTAGAEPVDLTRRPGDDRDPAWSPDGKQIAFTSYYRDDGMPQLFLMSPDGNTQTRISERFAEHSPTWTPQADFLVYVLDYANTQTLHMRDRWSNYLTDSKFDRSSDAGRLGLVADPEVSLDGSMIVYTRLEGSKTNVYTAVFKDRGKTITQLTTSGVDYAPTWSADGKWILFTSERDGNQEIYIMTADGQQVTNLTNFAGVDKDPAWQPAIP